MGGVEREREKLLGDGGGFWGISGLRWRRSFKEEKKDRLVLNPNLTNQIKTQH